MGTKRTSSCAAHEQYNAIAPVRARLSFLRPRGYVFRPRIRIRSRLLLPRNQRTSITLICSHLIAEDAQEADVGTHVVARLARFSTHDIMISLSEEAVIQRLQKFAAVIRPGMEEPHESDASHTDRCCYGRCDDDGYIGRARTEER